MQGDFRRAGGKIGKLGKLYASSARTHIHVLSAALRCTGKNAQTLSGITAHGHYCAKAASEFGREMCKRLSIVVILPPVPMFGVVVVQ